MIIDWSKIKKIYFIGIKGVAMSGLAVIYKQKGFTVAGSDVPQEFITDKILQQENILVFSDFKEKNLDWRPDLVVIGASWGTENPEVLAVKQKNILTITDSELRGELSREKQTIAVAGVHGKTTTTAILAYLFFRAGLDPSFLIGTGQIEGLSGNGHWGQGQYFIVEGDEYIRSQTERTPKFLDLNPVVSIITSVEWEHVDVFENLGAIEKAFEQLIIKTKDLVVVCGDWPSIKKIITGDKEKIVTYGFEKNNLWQACDVRNNAVNTFFKVKKDGKDFGEFTLSLFGRHNVLNALASIIVSLQSGVSLEQIKKTLPDFKGAQRRFEVFSSAKNIFVDDYGHHPSEIKATLQAVAGRYPDRKIWCVFQPHTASRTKALLIDFSQSFKSVDKIIIADIFASAREDAMAITSFDLAEEIKKFHPDVMFGGSLQQIARYLKNNLPPEVVLVTMGAGDVYKIRDSLR